MFRSLAGFGLVSIGLVWSAAAAAEMPSGPAPDWGRARLANGKVHVQTAVCKPIYETKVKEVVAADGTPQSVTYTVCILQAEMKLRTVDLADARIITIGGTRLDDAAVQSLLAKDTDVLVLSTGRRLDPAYAAVYAAETPVLYLRPMPEHTDFAPAAPAPAAPDAAPMPVDLGWRPSGIAPSPSWAQVVNGELQITQYFFDPRSITQTRQVIKKVTDGGVVKDVIECVPYSETLWVPSRETSTAELADVQILDRAGQPTAPSDLAQALATPLPVIFLQPGNRLDPEFGKFLGEKVLVLQAPASSQSFFNHVGCYLPLVPQLAQIKGDELHLTKPVCETVLKQEQYTENGADGVPLIKTRTIEHKVCKLVQVAEKVGTVQALLASGEKLTDDKLRELLTERTQVFYSPLAHVGPALLAMLKPEAIVLHPLPDPGLAVPAMPAPATPPLPVLLPPTP